MTVRPIDDLSPLSPCPRPDAPTVYIETYGCQMNVYDSSVIAAMLGGAGLVESHDPGTADVILINT